MRLYGATAYTRRFNARSVCTKNIPAASKDQNTDQRASIARNSAKLDTIINMLVMYDYVTYMYRRKFHKRRAICRSREKSKAAAAAAVVAEKLCSSRVSTRPRHRSAGVSLTWNF